MPESSQSMEVKDIRSEPITFQITLLKQVERINFMIPDTLKYLNPKTALALGGSIKTLEAMLRPYSKYSYAEKAEGKKERVKALEELLKKEDKSKRKLYVDALIEWYEVLLEQLSQVGVVSKPRKRLVCLSREDFVRLGEEVFGRGKVKIEFVDEVEETTIEASEEMGGFSGKRYTPKYKA